jgi:hypothetical protein
LVEGKEFLPIAQKLKKKCTEAFKFSEGIEK